MLIYFLFPFSCLNQEAIQIPEQENNEQVLYMFLHLGSDNLETGKRLWLFSRTEIGIFYSGTRQLGVWICGQALCHGRAEVLRLAILSSSLSPALHPGPGLVLHIRNFLPDFPFFSSLLGSTRVCIHSLLHRRLVLYSWAVAPLSIDSSLHGHHLSCVLKWVYENTEHKCHSRKTDTTYCV